MIPFLTAGAAFELEGGNGKGRKMNCIIEIKGREAIPVRAIPYITGWVISPDVVAFSLAQSSDFSKLGKLMAHHISPDGSIGDMLPKEWDGIEDMLEALSCELTEKNPDNKITRPEWLRCSIPLLPSHCFVWRDEFEKEYYAARERIFFAYEPRQGDADLNFNPRIPPECSDVVFEGIQSIRKKEMLADDKTGGNYLYISENLAAMQLAAKTFWENADPADKTTHPNNAKVAEWLVKHDFSSTLARSAASIIRPKWAASGRKPEQ